jgi:hypothetical protein
MRPFGWADAGNKKSAGPAAAALNVFDVSAFLLRRI